MTKITDSDKQWQTRRPHIINKIILIITIFMLNFSCNPLMDSFASDTPDKQILEVELQDGLLTVDAQNVKLEKVLDAIGENAGFDVVINGMLDSQPSSWSFDSLPPIEIIRSMVDEYNIAMHYDFHDDKTSSENYGTLWIFGNFTSNFEDTESVENYSRTHSLSMVLQQDDDPSARLQAINELSTIGGAEASEALAKGLGDSDPSIRIEVVRSLGSVGAENAIPTLAQVLYSDPDSDVRLAAVQTIAEQDSEVAKIFLKVAIEDKDETVREVAKEALNRLEP